ncbi:hypothetical protein [Sphaerospermopsis torques-reginae]|uniref:Transposase n=1 Tax=Sphaerospermopsis torques-reginae ITEP-024 TaxID=984208 RepID=A0ABX8X0J8_9CYAN|nr:hypothetical protein [Sphaerospermopsis torques-reginae]QYX32228.1 hypothetical protein K2F26_02100 [Sphaerospermopsis torques-reginae ITEP-024]
MGVRSSCQRRAFAAICKPALLLHLLYYYSRWGIMLSLFIYDSGISVSDRRR